MVYYQRVRFRSSIMPKEYLRHPITFVVHDVYQKPLIVLKNESS